MKNEQEPYSMLLPQNNVEGFDPNDLLVWIDSTDERGNATKALYMSAQAAMAWFFTVHPNGALIQEVAFLDATMATVLGKVFFDKDDPTPNATAFCTRRYDMNDKYNKDYVQNAGTCAIRKALGNCGFGTPFGAHETPFTSNTVVDTEDPVDGGVVARMAVPKVKPTASEPKKAEDAPKPQPAPESKTPERKAPEEAPKPEAPVAPVAEPVIISPPAPVAVKSSAPPPPKNFEEASKFIIGTGMHKGKTIEETYKEGGGDAIRSLHKMMKERFGRNNLITALEIFSEMKGC